MRGPPSTIDEFRALFSESRDPRQWPHVASGLTYRRAIHELAAFFGVEDTEAAVFERRAASDPADYGRRRWTPSGMRGPTDTSR